METRQRLRKFALLAGAALLPVGAMATPPAEQHVLQMDAVTQTEIVRYSVPESITPDGAKKLYRRLQTAAFRVCSLDGAFIGHAPEWSCVADALNKAVADVGSRPVSDLHARKRTGGDRLAVAKTTPPAELETFASR